MEQQKLQQAFFDILKNKIPENISVANQIAELLNVSIDSAYRRMRGQKELSLQELKILCINYGISLDALIHNTTDVIAFNYRPINSEDYTIYNYLQSIAGILEHTYSFKEKIIYFEGKDLPLANFLYFPEITQFKIFFWSRVMINDPAFADQKINFDKDDAFKYNKISSKIINLLQVISTIEIWNQDTINSTIKQIEYCAEMGYFENEEVFQRLINRLYEWVEHFQKQAETGVRFIPGNAPSGIEPNFKLFITEVVLPNNNILIKKDKYYTAYLAQNDLTLLVTRNIQFCIDQKKWIDNLIKKSSLITGTSEKERNKFFLNIKNKIDKLKNKLLVE